MPPNGIIFQVLKSCFLIFSLTLFLPNPGLTQVRDINFGNLGLARMDHPDYGYEEGIHLLLQADQKVLHFGDAGTSATFGSKGLLIVRYDIDGKLDNTFGIGGTRVVRYEDIYDTYYFSSALQSDQKILVNGYCGSCQFVQRYDTFGNLDESFADSGTLNIYEESYFRDDVRIRVLANDDFYLIRRTRLQVDLDYSFSVYRFTADGQADESFGQNGMVDLALPNSNEFILSNFIALENEGILATGTMIAYDAYGEIVNSFALLRWHPDGTLDDSFGENGLSLSAVRATRETVLQPDGKIVCVGSVNVNQQGTSGNMVVSRYLQNGMIDLSFSNDGHQTIGIDSYADYGNAVVIQEDGKILVGGSFFNFAGGSVTDCVVVRLLADGSFDNNFGEEGIFKTGVSSGTDRILDMVLQDEDHLIFGGVGNYQTSFDMITARIDLDGELVSNDQEVCIGESKTLYGYTAAEIYGWANADAPEELISTFFIVTVEPEEETTYLFYTDQDTTAVTLSPIEGPSVQLPSDTILCSGQQLFVDASFPDASYVWQDGGQLANYTITKTGTYWVAVTNECGTVSDSLEVRIEDFSNVDLGNDTSFCNTNSFILEVPAANYNFLWSDGSEDSAITIANSGAYWVDVSANGCSLRDSIQIDFLSSSQSMLTIESCEDYISPSGNYT